MRGLLLAAALFLVLPSFASAQPKSPSQDDLKKQKEKLLQDPFLKNGSWTTDYEKALAEAKKSGKPIFVYFTRSYAE